MTEKFELPPDDGHFQFTHPLRERLRRVRGEDASPLLPVDPNTEQAPSTAEEPIVEVTPDGALEVEGVIVVPPNLPGKDAFGD